jgi:hypothetical protein
LSTANVSLDKGILSNADPIAVSKIPMLTMMKEKIKSLQQMYSDVSPLDSEHVVHATVLQRREATRIRPIPTLAVITTDCYLHLFHLPPGWNTGTHASDHMDTKAALDTYIETNTPTSDVEFLTTTDHDSTSSTWSMTQMVPSLSICTSRPGTTIVPLGKTRIHLQQDDSVGWITTLGSCTDDHDDVLVEKTQPISLILEVSKSSEQSVLLSLLQVEGKAKISI